MNQKRHKGDTKTFGQLTFNQQILAMNMLALNFRRQLTAHLRRAEKEGHVRQDVLRDRLKLLHGILRDFPVQEVRVDITKIRRSTDDRSPH